MSKSKDKRKKRQSTARRRADQHASGYETTMLRIPEGLSFWKAEKGTRVIDIIPYVVKVENEFVDEGTLHYERTFYAYRNVGVEEKSYICSSKTFGKADYIQEWKAREAKRDEVDSETLKSFNPKERQLFLIYDHGDAEKGLQLWEFSYFCFGQLLDSRIQNSDEEEGWDLFYFMDEDGKSLRLTIEEQTGGGYKFLKVTAIDFVKRKEDLPKKIVDHDICLDDLLIETSYEKLKNIFNGVEEESGDTKSKKEPEPEKEPVEDESSSPTANDLGLSKGDEVNYNGELHTILKISKDGSSLMLLDENDNPVKAIAPDEVTVISDEPEDDDDKDDNESEDDDDLDDEWDDD